MLIAISVTKASLNSPHMSNVFYELKFKFCEIVDNVLTLMLPDIIITIIVNNLTSESGP